jgi:hypothetical protein
LKKATKYIHTDFSAKFLYQRPGFSTVPVQQYTTPSSQPQQYGNQQQNYGQDDYEYHQGYGEEIFQMDEGFLAGFILMEKILNFLILQLFSQRRSNPNLHSGHNQNNPQLNSNNNSRRLTHNIIYQLV